MREKDQNCYLLYQSDKINEKIENILLQLETYVKEKQKINQRRLTESGHHRSEIMPSLMAQVDVNVIIRINIYRKKQYRYKRQKWF